MDELAEDDLRLLTICPDCFGTRAVVNIFGEPDLCFSCVLMPEDPFGTP
jgi:hypothetical protein